MSGSDSETELKKGKKEKKDKGKDKDKDEKKEKKNKDKDEKKNKDKDEKKKDKERDKDKKERKDKKDKKDEGEDDDDDEDRKKRKDKDKKDKPSSHPFDANVSSSPAHGGEAANYYNPSGKPSQPSQPSQPAHPPQSGEVPWFLREPGTEPIRDQRPPRVEPDFPDLNPHYSFQRPPQQQSARAVGDAGGVRPVQNFPLSGHRVPLGPNTQFPSPDQLGRPPTTDFDGSTPVFVGSAIFPDSVHPCKIVPSLHCPCRVSYGGSEVEHHGRYDLLPVTQDMEWVPTKNGQIPYSHRPVEGGYESNGGKLYHALGFTQGIHVPGKAGEHLGGASIPFGGREHNLQENYSILCWK
ncbi:hypothetical protein BDM02DRAFT_3118621 [Thelephora ganbajun]|uniref:Uncharacterized protein n=1 Tax=Thelephora ganbajun TaxID=370292 RepID=A0ACB6Z9T8_THEGA|nr:hypothetical protein BDM02DRAFT_3118621 [Thelephora ganbajun]